MATHIPNMQGQPREYHDCWNQIGVSGNGTCPELAKVVHCRNCPVYAAGGRSLLEREPPAEYLHEWTQALAEVEVPERVAEHVIAARRKVNECRHLLADRLTELELFARRSENLANRLYREAIASRMRPLTMGCRVFRAWCAISPGGWGRKSALRSLGAPLR